LQGLQLNLTMIWQVSQFCKPKIGTKIEYRLFYISVFSGIGTIKANLDLHHRAEKRKNGKPGCKLCPFFSETPNEITKTGVFAFCKSPNRIEMNKK